MKKTNPGVGIDLLLAAGVIVVLFSLAWSVWLVPKLGWGFGGTLFIAVVVLGGVLVSGFWVWHRFPDPRSLFGVTWPSLIAPILGGGMLLLSLIRWDGMPEWALQGDMVWNTASALFINESGGVLYESHANPAPLTNAIFSLSYGLNPSFEAVLRGNAIMVTTMLVLVSLLGGVHVARLTAHASAVVRVLLVFAAGWLPFTAIVLDGMFRLGLANVIVSYLILWAVWIFHMATELRGSVRVVFLLMSGTVLLASWAPLASVAIALVVFAYFEQRQRWSLGLLQKKQDIIWQALAVVSLLAYVVCVTLPDLRKAGGHLGANGAFPPLDAAEALVILVIAALFAINAVQVGSRGSSAWQMGAGALSVMMLAGVAFVYLVMQRPPGESFWGYYPMKLASLTILLLVGASISIISTFILKSQKLARQAVIAASVLPIYLIAILSPAQWSISLSTFAPAASAMLKAPDPSRVQLIRDLIVVENANLEGVEVFVNWIDEQDAFGNTFLFQLAVDQGDDPIRGFAYTFDPKEPGQLCDVVETANQTVTVFTRLDADVFHTRYLANCAVAEQVVVLNELPE